MHRPATFAVLALALAGCGSEPDASLVSEALASPGAALPALEEERLLAGARFNFYVEAPSPDGRYLTDVDWSTGDLALRDLTTGELRRVTDKGSWSESDDYAEYGRFSPEGDRILYTWFKGPTGRPETEIAGYELRSVGIDGSDVRVHMPAREDVQYVKAEDWSPDGSTLLVTVARADRTSQIGLVSYETDEYTILKSTDWRKPLKASFSEDGRWIAFDFRPEPESPDRDVFVLAVDGSRERPLVEGEGNHRFMGWLPDRSGILFHHDDGGARSLYIQRVREGRPVGTPELVKEDVWSIHSFGFSRESFFYGTHVARPQLHVQAVDLEAGRALSEPEPVVNLTEPSTRHPAWSPDGQSLAYLSPLENDAGVDLVVRSLGGEIVQRLWLHLDPALKLDWTEIGPVVAGRDAEGRVALWKVALETGGLEELSPPPRAPVGDVGGLAFSAVSPDGGTVYYQRRVRPDDPDPRRIEVREDRREEIVARDVATGEERSLAVFGAAQRMNASPDRTRLAVMAIEAESGRRGIWIVPTDGGEPRLLHAQRPGREGFAGNHEVMPFTPDGRSILFTEWDEPADGEAVVRTLYRIPLDGSGPVPVMDLPASSLGRELTVSPDGRRITFRAGEPRGEIWRLSGFASEDEGSVDRGAGGGSAPAGGR